VDDAARARTIRAVMAQATALRSGRAPQPQPADRTRFER
jgi:hypothetical protein